MNYNNNNKFNNNDKIKNFVQFKIFKINLTKKQI